MSPISLGQPGVWPQGGGWPRAAGAGAPLLRSRTPGSALQGFPAMSRHRRGGAGVSPIRGDLFILGLSAALFQIPDNQNEQGENKSDAGTSWETTTPVELSIQTHTVNKSKRKKMKCGEEAGHSRPNVLLGSDPSWWPLQITSPSHFTGRRPPFGNNLGTSAARSVSAQRVLPPNFETASPSSLAFQGWKDPCSAMHRFPLIEEDVL